jgi:fibronectin type 3 domain-containing protein
MRRLGALLAILLFTGYASAHNFHEAHHSHQPLPVPTGLTATPGNSKVTLNWSASKGARRYHVKRSFTSGGRYWYLDTTWKTSFTDRHVKNGHTYYYVVSAVGWEEHSKNSAEVAATPSQGPVTVPTTPSGFSATAGNGQVTLSWNASSGATGYHLKRSSASGGPYTQIAAPTGTSATDSGLTNGTTYFYVVSAFNSAGESTNSAPVSTTPKLPMPGVPTGLSATAGNQQIALSWSVGSGATSYNVKRSTTSGGPYTQVSAPTGTNFTDTGLTNGTTYFYVVSAVNASGESANSTQASGTPKAPVPAVPTGLSATGGNLQVSLSWNTSSGATSYNVKRSATSGGPYTVVGSPTATSFTDTGLTAGTTYFYVVSAVNASGESANSTPASASTNTALPTAPSGVLATAGNNQIVVEWSAVSGATGYKVKRATSSGGPYTLVATPMITSFTDTSVTDGTTYFYVVSAINSSGEGANSAQVSAAPLPPAPAAPTGLAATAGDQQVSLSWNASTGATSYNVKRSTTTGGPYSLVTTSAGTTFTDTSLTNGTTYFYVVSASNSSGESADSAQMSATPAHIQADVTVTVDPTKTHPISPWIYGINSFSSIPNAPHTTMDRMGGNRWTAYNWETNASNAGSDYNYQNDNFLSSSSIPGEAVRPVIEADQNAGMASLMTVQLQGLVAGDENGPVSVANPPDLTRFKRVGFKKSLIVSTPFTLTPPTTDSIVYMDEFVWAMDQKFPGMGIFGANPTYPTFISLDNEPELWNSTHLELQDSTPVDSDTYIVKTINLTKAIKDQFPNAVIFGPVHYGFQGIYNWQGEFTATPNGADWFPDRYLPALKSASTTYGRPLVDVYDFHWYAEDYDSNGTRVTDLSGTNLTDAQVQLIVQSPRNLWDPTFTDSGNSNRWINNELGGASINILGRLQSKIDSEFPGMKMAITEYESGGWNHIAGTIAQADNLGIFGSQGLFAASFWPPNGTYDYALAGFRAFRGFDGGNANFGDTSLQATSSNVQNVVVYASTDSSTPGRVVFVAINRTSSPQVTAINGETLSGTASMYQMTASSAQGQNPVEPISIGQMPVSGSSLTLTLPAYSVTTIDVH